MPRVETAPNCDGPHVYHQHPAVSGPPSCLRESWLSDTPSAEWDATTLIALGTPQHDFCDGGHSSVARLAD